MKKNKWISIDIKIQGGPILSDIYGYIETKGKNIVAIEIDLKSKYCDVDYTIHGSDGDCGIGIVATEESLHINKKKKEVATEIYFPEFNGWYIWATNLSRYTLYVCLVREPIGFLKYLKNKVIK